MSTRLVAVAALLPLVVGCAATPRAAKVCQERRVHIGSMGQGDHATQFALVLEGELHEEGFEVVGRQEDADLVLTGVLTISQVGTGALFGNPRGIWGGARSGTQPTIVAQAFHARSGQELWRKYYESNKPKSLQSRADDVAEDLWEACLEGWRPRK